MEKQQQPEEIKPPFKDQHMSPPGIEEKLDPKPLYYRAGYFGSKKLQDKKALVTGGDSGIGRAVCVLFAREGADVAFTYLPEELVDAKKTAKAIENEGRQAVMIEVDLTAEEASEKVIELVVKEFGGLDILVNNAAFQKHLDEIEELDFEQFHKTFDLNLFSPFKLVKAALPHFNKKGSIINTGSILGYIGDDELIDYSSSKGAIHTFTKSLAKHLAKRKIRVNSVAPGPVWTPLNPAERDAEDIKKFGKSTSFGRPAQPEEIAPAFVFLASEITGSYITGETINLFGQASGAN